MDHAQALLDARYGVEEPARMVGFGSPETMRRLFLAMFGVSPSQYRAPLHDNNSGLEDRSGRLMRRPTHGSPVTPARGFSE